MKMESMESIPTGANPFQYDYFHMGTQVSDSVMVMHPGGPDTPYVILVDMRNGERKKVFFTGTCVECGRRECICSDLRDGGFPECPSY